MPRTALNRKVASVYKAYTPISFQKVQRQAKDLADYIESNFESLADILLEYESFEVVKDETARTLDLLRNLKENEQYFKLRIGRVVSFLPRNQPLYALTCFVIVPALMAGEVHFRIPHAMKHFFPRLLDFLKINKRFLNIYPSEEQHLSFLKKHTALRVDPATKKTLPLTDVVVFTGTPSRADQLRSVFDSRTLFISNGSGHNPVIVAADADLNAAAEAVLSLQLYNQGQDCAAPNSILVHKKNFRAFHKKIKEKLGEYKIGPYRDKNNKIGPISEPADLLRIQDFLIKNKRFIDPQTPGIIRVQESIMEPTIVSKPLRAGGNFVETFAPIIVLQQYDSDDELASYFEHPDYAQNAMYVTLYGTSSYAKKLIGKKVDGKLLHDRSTFLHNTHLHMPGVERGTKPYGGYGFGGSNLWFKGRGLSKPTLPQRDIYELVVSPLLRRKSLAAYRKMISAHSNIEEKNVEKLLRFRVQVFEKKDGGSSQAVYLDTQQFAKQIGSKRYLKIEDAHTHRLLGEPNISYISTLSQHDLNHIRSLQELLLHKPNSSEEFMAALYAIVGSSESKAKKMAAQKKFFTNIYQLLFGQNNGPRLVSFLWELDKDIAAYLLSV